MVERSVSLLIFLVLFASTVAQISRTVVLLTSGAVPYISTFRPFTEECFGYQQVHSVGPLLATLKQRNNAIAVFSDLLAQYCRLTPVTMECDVRKAPDPAEAAGFIAGETRDASPLFYNISHTDIIARSSRTLSERRWC